MTNVALVLAKLTPLNDHVDRMERRRPPDRRCFVMTSTGRTPLSVDFPVYEDSGTSGLWD